MKRSIFLILLALPVLVSAYAGSQAPDIIVCDPLPSSETGEKESKHPQPSRQPGSPSAAPVSSK